MSVTREPGNWNLIEQLNVPIPVVIVFLWTDCHLRRESPHSMRYQLISATPSKPSGLRLFVNPRLHCVVTRIRCRFHDMSYSDSDGDGSLDTLSGYDSMEGGDSLGNDDDGDDDDDDDDDYYNDDDNEKGDSSSSSGAGGVNKRSKYKYPNFDQEKSRTTSFWLFLHLALRSYSRKQGSVIDGSMAGDYGFDVLGVVKTKARLKRMREIELKHARLAMLAAVGWPLSELYSEPLKRLADLGHNSLYQPSLTPEGLAPTVWNGGLLTGPNAVAFGLYLLLVSVLDYIGFSRSDRLRLPNHNLISTHPISITSVHLKFLSATLTCDYRRNSKKKAFDPGDFNFDPFNLYESKGTHSARHPALLTTHRWHRYILRGIGRSPFGRKRLRTLEVDNGRIAMVAVLVYFVSEYSSHVSIVERTPFFFTPVQGLSFFI